MLYIGVLGDLGCLREDLRQRLQLQWGLMPGHSCLEGCVEKDPKAVSGLVWALPERWEWAVLMQERSSRLRNKEGKYMPFFPKAKQKPATAQHCPTPLPLGIAEVETVKVPLLEWERGEIQIPFTRCTVTEADNSPEGPSQGKAPASITTPGTPARPALP